MKKWIFFLFVFGLLCSCDSKTKEAEKKALDKKEQDSIIQKHNKSKKALLIEEITRRYNVKYNWDTLEFRFKFSFEYDPIIKSKCQIIENFYINDIYSQDTNYILNIGLDEHWRVHKSRLYGLRRYCFGLGWCHFSLIMAKSQIDSVLSQKFKKILIVSTTKVEKLRFGIAGEIDDAESGSVSLNIENSDQVLCKGRLLKIVYCEPKKTDSLGNDLPK